MTCYDIRYVHDHVVYHLYVNSYYPYRTTNGLRRFAARKLYEQGLAGVVDSRQYDVTTYKETR